MSNPAQILGMRNRGWYIEKSRVPLCPSHPHPICEPHTRDEAADLWHRNLEKVLYATYALAGNGFDQGVQQSINQ